MKLGFHPDARAEMEESAVWYESRKPGLGDEFLLEVQSRLARIVNQPERWREVEVGVRSCPLSRFPFAIIFRIRAETVQIIAIKHHRRRPGYWKARL